MTSWDGLTVTAAAVTLHVVVDRRDDGASAA
jgi:hypothetical protein